MANVKAHEVKVDACKFALLSGHRPWFDVAFNSRSRVRVTRRPSAYAIKAARTLELFVENNENFLHRCLE